MNTPEDRPTPIRVRSTSQVEAEVAEELAHHFDLSVQELIEAGMEHESAAAEARRRFGNYSRVQRACINLQLGKPPMSQRLPWIVTGALGAAALLLLVATLQARRSAAEAHHALRAEVDLAWAQREQIAMELERARRPEQVDTIVLGVGDIIELVDENHADLHAVERVGRDGQVLVPSVGWVMLAGLSRSDAEAAVTKAAALYYADPLVRIKVDPYLGDRTGASAQEPEGAKLPGEAKGN